MLDLSVVLNSAMIIMYGLSWFLFCLTYFMQVAATKKYGTALMILGAFLTGVSILVDIIGRQGDFTHNVSLLLKSMGIFSVLYYLFKLKRSELEITGVVIPAFVMVLTMIARHIEGYGMIDNREWLSQIFIYIHIVTVLAAILFFGISCLLAVFYLILERKLKKRINLKQTASIPSLLVLKKFMLRFLYLGFLLFTGGLFFGLGSAQTPSGDWENLLRIVIPILIWVLYSMLIMVAMITQKIRQVAMVIIPAFLISIGFLFIEIFLVTL